MRAIGKILLLLLFVGAAAVLAWKIRERFQEDGAPAGPREAARAAPVEVAPVTRGPIELRRVFTGTLESPAEFVVAPKIPGRLEEIAVDLADPVRRGQVVARLDRDEYVQAVAQADADIVVAKANLAEAESALKIADRALERVETLQGRGVASESQLDLARADQLAKQAAVEVARAQVQRAESARESARIRLGYTEVVARWTGGDDERIVKDRFVDAGSTVSANTPLLSIVELAPITGVIFVAERDYARLAPGQPVELTTDAYPGERFHAKVDRIAPAFRQATRQARVELLIANSDRRLKPGMFIRVEVVLDRVEDALLVSESALTKRGDAVGVFVVDAAGERVAWKRVETGIRADGLVQILGGTVSGRVVTLGHQLIKDGSAVVIPGDSVGDPGAQ
jgi:RND family efflux transporter MFP subunit